MAHVQQLVQLVQKLSREAEKAARTGGSRELDTVQATAEQYLKLYQELKARGEIE